MTGKRYYLATLGAWRRHAARFANSHFLVLDARLDSATAPENPVATGHTREGNCDASGERDDTTPILVLVEADEGVHVALEDDPACEALPHPLAQKAISSAAQSALAAHGVEPGATTFDAAEALARVHPLLRHRVF